jgi:hypothetical protein
MFDSATASSPAELVAAIAKPEGLDEAAARLKHLIDLEAEKRAAGRALRMTPSNRPGEHDVAASRFFIESNELLPQISRALSELDAIRRPYVERIDAVLDATRQMAMRKLDALLAPGVIELRPWQNQRRTSFDIAKVSDRDVAEARRLIVLLDDMETARRSTGSTSWLTAWAPFLPEINWAFVRGRLVRLSKFR